MRMKERIGKQMNTERIEAALCAGSDTISTACPWCLVTIGGTISVRKSSGEAGESVEIVDTAQLLARSAGQPASGAQAPAHGRLPRPDRAQPLPILAYQDRPNQRDGRTLRALGQPRSRNPVRVQEDS